MIPTILLAISLALQPANPPSTEPAEHIKSLTSAEALVVIDHFLANPELGDEAKQIKKFAEDSDACLIAVDNDVAPWAAHDPPYQQTPVLLTAFVAGNVRAQLMNHKAEDDPYAGMLAVIKVYEKLRETDDKISIPEIDDTIAMEKRGELKAHADEIIKKREK